MKPVKLWWQIYLKQPWDKQVLLGAILLAAIPVAFTLTRPGLPAVETTTGAGFQVDTHIPKGFVLIPIEVQNYEALDSILGRFGIVDLYQNEQMAGSNQRLVARNIRILRAPQNPSHFAVLVPESQAHEVLRHGGEFTVIVKRPTEHGTEFVKDERRQRRSITYEGG